MTMFTACWYLKDFPDMLFEEKNTTVMRKFILCHHLWKWQSLPGEGDGRESHIDEEGWEGDVTQCTFSCLKFRILGMLLPWLNK